MRSEAIVPLASVLDIVPLETVRTLALAASALLVAAALAGAVATWMSAMRIHLPTSNRRPSGALPRNLDPLHVPQIVRVDPRRVHYAMPDRDQIGPGRQLAARDQLPRLIQHVPALAPDRAEISFT